MAFTAQLGTATSYPDNIELGLGAGITPFNKYSGLYKLTPGKTNDTLYSNINYPQVETLIVKIPDPFIESGLIGD